MVHPQPNMTPTSPEPRCQIWSAQADLIHSSSDPVSDTNDRDRGPRVEDSNDGRPRDVDQEVPEPLECVL